MRRHKAAIAAAAVTLCALAAALVALAGGRQQPAAERDAESAARAFLARYVLPNGRVVRRDQGGDTVSEGQSYALLLAQVAGDDRRFARVWHWTRTHLQRPDGLLAFRVDARGVRYPMPATDADLVTAWALLRAGGSGAKRYHAAGRRMAGAILERETGRGRVLAAGPWATGQPTTVNPSYLAAPALQALARADRRWRGYAPASVALIRSLTAGGRLLPPDWARIDGRRARPTPPPDGSVPDVRYGLDAQRTVVWMAAACTPGGRPLAARWWPALARPGRSSALALDQRGNVRDPHTHPLPLVAAAAAAGAAGHHADRDRLLAQAAEQDRAHPTYYGAAWVALGRALLTTDKLGGCATNGGNR